MGTRRLGRNKALAWLAIGFGVLATLVAVMWDSLPDWSQTMIVVCTVLLVLLALAAYLTSRPKPPNAGSQPAVPLPPPPRPTSTAVELGPGAIGQVEGNEFVGYDRGVAAGEKSLVKVKDNKIKRGESGGAGGDLLPIHIDLPITAFIEDECKVQTGDPHRDPGYLVQVIGLSLTNQTKSSMSLDLSASLRLLKESGLRRMSVNLRPLQIPNFNFGNLKVRKERTRHDVSLAFLLNRFYASACLGIRNIAKDGHTLRVADRVSGRVREFSFQLGGHEPDSTPDDPPSNPDSEAPPSTGDGPR